MFRHILFAILCVVVIASAETILQPEQHFFGMPGVDSLSTDFFLAKTDSSDFG